MSLTTHNHGPQTDVHTIEDITEKDMVVYPESDALSVLYSTPPDRVIVSAAYCLKDLNCTAGRFTYLCEPNCKKCAMSQIRDRCHQIGFTFRIDISGKELKQQEEAIEYHGIGNNAAERIHLLFTRVKFGVSPHKKAEQ